MKTIFPRNAALYTSRSCCVPGPLTLANDGLRFTNHTLRSTPEPGVLRIRFEDLQSVELSDRRWPHTFKRCLVFHLVDGTAHRLWVARVSDSLGEVRRTFDTWCRTR